MPSSSSPSSGAPRKPLLVVLLVGLLGTLAELILIEHTEDTVQLAPLVVMGLSAVAITWDLFAWSRASLVTVRAACLALLACGAWGAWLHYTSNAEFQRELDTELRGGALVLAALRSHSPPSLAPGALAILSALGLVASRGR